MREGKDQMNPKKKGQHPRKKHKIKIDKKGKKRKKKTKKGRRIEGEMKKTENSNPTSRLQVSDMYLKIIRVYAT